MVGELIVDVKGFQKIYGLHGLKHHKVEIRGGVTRWDERKNDEQTREDRATQPLDCWKAEFRKMHSWNMYKLKAIQVAS